MNHRSNYWSCSKFADWVRGTDKGSAKTSEGWKSWRMEAKQSHPVRYWIAETLLDKIQDFLYWPTDILYNIKYYVNNRWVTRTHCLTASPTHIKPGVWTDVGNRFLPCMFNELVDFVEIELAWSNIHWSEENKNKFKAPWWSFGFFRWRTWRSPESGIDYLNWAKTLAAEQTGDDGEKILVYSSQAQAANEILELYNWWKYIRPIRPDAMKQSGWSDYCEKTRLDDEFSPFSDNKDSDMVKNILDKCNEIEKMYEDEDEQMLIRLIKVRNHLWT
jgi:hypothetical protein